MSPTAALNAARLLSTIPAPALRDHRGLGFSCRMHETSCSSSTVRPGEAPCPTADHRKREYSGTHGSACSSMISKAEIDPAPNSPYRRVTGRIHYAHMTAML